MWCGLQRTLPAIPSSLNLRFALQELDRVQWETATLSGLDEALQRRHYSARERLEMVEMEARRQADSIAILRQQKAEL